jgi:hypothetical protein
MTTKRFDPVPELASDVAIDQALRPFIQRFVQEARREHATAVYLPNTAGGAPGTRSRHEWRGLIAHVDKQRGRTFTATELAPWLAVRGVFLVDRDAFAVDAKTAIGLYVPTEWMFVAYGATFAIVADQHGKLLLT